MTWGVVYVAYGDKARAEVLQSVGTMYDLANCPLDIAIVSDSPLEGFRHIPFPDLDPGGRIAKLNLDELSPFDLTAYIDADTRVYQPITAGFEILEAGWELVIVPSANQIDNDRLMWHIDSKEIVLTLDELGYDPLQLQGGVMFFRKSEAIRAMFRAWRDEWTRFQKQDQAALLRALHRQPVRLWLLGRPWNGGAVIAHHFGQARRD